MRISLIYWAECQSHEEALARLQEVLAEEGLESRADIEKLEIETEEEARRVSFGGSPTILVDGEDIDPGGRDASGRLTCRAYRRADGSVSPVPDKETIRVALRKHERRG